MDTLSVESNAIIGLIVRVPDDLDGANVAVM